MVVQELHIEVWKCWGFDGFRVGNGVGRVLIGLVRSGGWVGV